MLNVGLDLRGLKPGFKAHFGRGTGRYVAELVKHLRVAEREQSGATEACHIVPVSADTLARSAWQERILRVLPFGRTSVDTQVFLPGRIGMQRLDLFHFFAHGDATPRCPIPYIVTVLDLIPLRFPDLYRQRNADWRFRLARFIELQAIRRATGVIAISEATRRDVVELVGVPEEKVAVTPLGVSDDFLTAPDRSNRAVEEVTRALGIPRDRPLILYVGGIDPRKNIIFLLNVYYELLRGWTDGPRPLLLLAGAYEKDDQYPRLRKTIAELGLERDVVLPGFVKEDDLPLLYRAATVTAFPSLYEGFGLPVLESMACGTPVVAARNSSIPEVAGDAAVLIDASDTDSWVRTLRDLLAAPEHLAELSALGLKRAGRFTWLQSAERTLQAYRDFASKQRAGSFGAAAEPENPPLKAARSAR